MSHNYRGLQLGARMVSGVPKNFKKTSFYQPVYDIHSNDGGVSNEALNVRMNGRCGIFDLSNMKQLNFTGNNIYRAINHLFTTNIYNCSYGKIQETLMLNEIGKVIDKPFVSNIQGNLSVFCRETTVPIIKDKLEDFSEVEIQDNSSDYDILAIQGTWSKAALNKLYYFLRLDFKNIVDKDKLCITQDDVTLVKKSITGAEGYLVRLPKSKTDTLLKKMLHQPNIYLSGSDALLVNQMESRMLTENELNGKYSPFELNQNHLVDTRTFDYSFTGRNSDINTSSIIKSVSITNYNFTQKPTIITNTNREKIGELKNLVWSPYLKKFKGICEITDPESKIGILDNRQIELMNIL